MPSRNQPSREGPDSIVATYLASDIHLRLDRPERGIRLARLVDRLEPTDHLVVVGDLCDFWAAARQMPFDPSQCQGLRMLVDFRRRGGRVTIMAGNHDRWLESYYRQQLGADFVLGSLNLTSASLRVHAVHGHLLGARAVWKGLMESRAFLNAFHALPHAIARQFEARLEQVNEQERKNSDDRFLETYRLYADKMRDQTDLIVLGHIHLTHDNPTSKPRVIVLGGWHDQASYLRVHDGIAVHHIETDPD